MILRNPLKDEVSIGILGTEYKIQPEKTIEVSDEVGLLWRKTHGFLQIVKEEIKEQEFTVTTAESLSHNEVLTETGEMTTGTNETKKVIRRGTKK